MIFLNKQYGSKQFMENSKPSLQHPPLIDRALFSGVFYPSPTISAIVSIFSI